MILVSTESACPKEHIYQMCKLYLVHVTDRTTVVDIDELTKQTKNNIPLTIYIQTLDFFEVKEMYKQCQNQLV